ncbi:MAG: asparaginase domain-containing protein [Thermoanaerobacteraceae bacterium]|nr:asparaginase domain-containing protein [Thermoanaerobacteraceae bacterium]
MKKIVIISTGGTIAMGKDESGLANIKKDTIIETFQFSNVPSSYLTLADLCQLRSCILGFQSKGYDVVVITHGTDTLEETAYFLDISLKTNIPIILTGAQRNPSLISSDGPLNLYDSILVASDDQAKEMGVVVVFSSEIVAAREATKFHRTRVDTFKSLEFGPTDSTPIHWLKYG